MGLLSWLLQAGAAAPTLGLCGGHCGSPWALHRELQGPFLPDKEDAQYGLQGRF